MVTIATMERRGTFPVKHTAVKGVTELQQPDGWFLLVPDQTRRCCDDAAFFEVHEYVHTYVCLLYTSPSPRDKRQSRMPSSA